MNLFFFIYMFFVSLFSLVMIRKHLLLVMMGLEFIVVMMLFFIFYICLMFSYSFYFYLFFMCFYVCEGVLGLSLLVGVVRLHGNDYLSSMFLW
uniref:NADH dehydrogenase subunit 4L n=1 Tax=Xestocephalus biprocessus TaxID=3112134 RepID=UPI002E765822|nr:NADH dehydrogenase subunit 4L [Xestocephalus biprocessus]WRK21293.1 NADH dehydrogenase subunit 4L [Xestocephalus biprocessus]